VRSTPTQKDTIQNFQLASVRPRTYES